jgi:fluoroacetyl-CoA thioesterase
VIEAEIQILKEGEINCSYTAWVGDRLIAEGTTGQKVFLKESLEKHFSRLSAKRD